LAFLVANLHGAAALRRRESECDIMGSMTIVKNKHAYVLAPRTMQDARKTLSQSWKRSAGMMQHHKRNMERYIARVRKEWK